MKRIILSTLLLILFFKSQGQVKIHIGASTAMNSTFVLDKGLKADRKSVV